MRFYVYIPNGVVSAGPDGRVRTLTSLAQSPAILSPKTDSLPYVPCAKYPVFQGRAGQFHRRLAAESSVKERDLLPEKGLGWLLVDARPGSVLGLDVMATGRHPAKVEVSFPWSLVLCTGKYQVSSTFSASPRQAMHPTSTRAHPAPHKKPHLGPQLFGAAFKDGPCRDRRRWSRWSVR